MYIFRSIHEIIQTVNASRTLLAELFEQRKAEGIRYSEALTLLKDDENRLRLLIEKEVVRQNGNRVEMDARFLDFFELLLEANEEISTATIEENIGYLKELMDYYLKEQIAARKQSYVRNVKITFQKIARTTLRNIIRLQNNIEGAFKHEPTYRIKIAKLEHLDQKRLNIQRLIDETEHFILHEEREFFRQAADEELTRIVLELRRELQLAAHSLIRAQQDIINYLNQIKHQVILVEKIRKVKYLQDQFELRTRSNLAEVVEREHALLMEGTSPASFKLSVNYLQTDEARPVILKVLRNLQFREAVRSNEAGAFSEEDLERPAMVHPSIDLEETLGNYLQQQAQTRWSHPDAPAEDLFSYLMHCPLPRETSESERTTLFCQLVSLFEPQLRVTDRFLRYKQFEYAVVLPQE